MRLKEGIVLKKFSACFVALLVLLWSVAASAQQTIRIGVNMELTGYSGEHGAEQYRGIVAAHHLQPSIEVNGVTYPIELVVCDNQTLREASAQCAVELAQQGVAGVLGGYSSSMSLAAALILQNEGVPMISTGATNPIVTQVGHFIFRIPFTDDYQGQAAASYAYEVLGARKVVAFRQADDDYSVGLARIFAEQFERLSGAVLVQSIDQADGDFTAQLNAARSFEPDLLFTSAFCPFAGPLVQQSRAAGFDQPWLGGDALDAPNCVELAGAAFEGVLFTGFPNLMQLEPDALERAGVIEAAYMELYPNSTGFGGSTLAGSDAYGVLLQAIEQVLAAGYSLHDITWFRLAVRDVLASTTDYPGVTGTITFAGTDGTPASRTIGLLQVEDVAPDGTYTRSSQGYFVIEPGGTVFIPAE